MLDTNHQLSKLFPAKLMPFIVVCVSSPEKLATGIKKTAFSWQLILQAYFVFLAIALTIIDRIFKYHKVDGLSLFDAAFYYTLFVPVLAWLLMLPFTFSKNRANFNKHLKATFVISGILFILNALLLPFQIYLEFGGNKWISFIPAALVVLWTIRAWTTFTILNNTDKFYKKLIAFFLTAIVVALTPLVTAVLVKYFVYVT